MTIMHVEYLGELRTRARHDQSGAELLTDAPKDNHGKGEAFSPTDLLATSLATCMLSIMGIKARALGVKLEGMSCQVEKIMQASPRKVAEVKLAFQWGPHALSDEHKAALQEAAMSCPVVLSLDASVKKTVSW